MARPKSTAPAVEPACEPVAPNPAVGEAAIAPPVAEAPVIEPAVVEASAVEAPAVEAPAVEAPVVEAPVVEAPVIEAPVAVAVAMPPSAAQDRTAPSPEKDAIMDTFEAATQKTHAMFAGLNDRTKGAMEKGTHLIEEFNAFGKGNIEALVESSKIAAKAMETVGQDVTDYAKGAFESSAAAMKTLASASSPTEYFRLQGDYARSTFDTMIAQGSHATEKMLKLAGEIAQPISNRVAVATDRLKGAA
jgi:phasin family protein